eukprot:CAMPEP_0183462256 /NCGR_PEP_ID=MMETSP0370-20130417/141329_1 /TAXON_ID=268820 /ORGANISM="Peridinium aciculiferum, Strain PAER-2" /LENGTH=56 /DNA_ID=CAMNT_0025654267 /DNA_START=114 /DNA_END=281 /DNA_ORIENTATION=-
MAPNTYAGDAPQRLITKGTSRERLALEDVQSTAPTTSDPQASCSKGRNLSNNRGGS